MKSRMPLRPGQRWALLGMVLLIALATVAWSILDVAGDEYDKRLAATLIRDDATWLQQSIEHHLDVRLAYTDRRAGPAGLAAAELPLDAPQFLVTFDDAATRIDLAWSRLSGSAYGIVPTALRERFDVSTFGDRGATREDGSIVLPIAEVNHLVQRGDSRQRAVLSIFAFAIADQHAVLDEYGFAMERYAHLLTSMLDAMEDWRRLEPDTPFPGDLQRLHDTATRVRAEMRELGALLQSTMENVLDTDLPAATRGRFEQAYNERIPDVNGYLAATWKLVDRFTAVGRKHELAVDEVMAAHRDILDTLFDIRVAPNETWRIVSQLLLMVAITMTVATFVLVVVFNRLRLPSVVRREMRGFGVQDARLARDLVDRYRDRWFRESDVRAVLVAIRHDVREWTKQHRESMLFGLRAPDDAVAPPERGADETPDEAAVEPAAKPDKRQARRQRREERERKREAPEVITAAERRLDQLLKVLRVADFDLYDLENVPEPRQQELARYIPEARRRLPRRLWRQWCRDFVGSDDETWQPFIDRARKDDWDGLRDLVSARGASASSATPTETDGEPHPQIFADQNVVVIGGNPWMRGFYLQAVQQLGARKARWFDGSHDVSRVDRLGADVVIMLYKGLSHGTSRRVRARALPGRQARIIFSDHPGRSRFISSILDSPVLQTTT